MALPNDTYDVEDDLQVIFDNTVFNENTGVHASDQLTSPSDSDGQTEAGPTREFDTNIPTLHKYLGKLNPIRGYHIFEDGEHLTLIAIHTNTIVSPGFILPLIVDIPIEQEIMNKCITERCVFAVVFHSEQQEDIFLYGIIMEVFESYTKDNSLYLKARGRQRCKVLLEKDVKHLGGRLAEITVMALGEPDIKSPISSTQLLHLKAFRPYCYKDYTNSQLNRKYRRYHQAQFPYASWIYDHNEVYYYCKLVVESLQKHYSKDYIPSDPVSLSYWFLQNFQLLYLERLEILKQISVLCRLKLEHKYLMMNRTICCHVCKQDLADYTKVFAMSRDGVQSTFCNPGGYVYETVTVTRLENCTLVGMPTKEFSWFPGYEWTIAQCIACRAHIGWKFTSKCLQPPEFFGLARTNLDIKILTPPDDPNVV